MVVTNKLTATIDMRMDDMRFPEIPDVPDVIE